MTYLANPFRKTREEPGGLDQVPYPSSDVAAVRQLLSRCPHANTTPLLHAADLTAHVGGAQVFVKDESQRMGMGSFKALGAAYVIARDAQSEDVSDVTYVTASAGNHGLSVAAGAAAFGARSVIYLSETVPEAFAERLRNIGANVNRAGDVYEASMEAARLAAEANGWRLLSDSSWPGYTERPHRLMEGYTVLMAEALEQMPVPPTHLFLQAGVGGLAAACAAAARALCPGDLHITVVEPEAALALTKSIQAGKAVTAPGPVSKMGRLDCKDPSLIAFKGLARDADVFVGVTEAQAQDATELAQAHGLPSTPSGIAGLAAAMAYGAQCGITATARVLIILSEGPEVA